MPVEWMNEWMCYDNGISEPKLKLKKKLLVALCDIYIGKVYIVAIGMEVIQMQKIEHNIQVMLMSVY